MTMYALAGSEQSGMSALDTLRANGDGEIIPSRTTLNKEYAVYKSKEASGYLLKQQALDMLKWVHERSVLRGAGAAVKILRLAIDATDILPRLYINPHTLQFSGDVKCGVIGGEDPTELQETYIMLMRPLESIMDGSKTASLEEQARSVLAVVEFVSHTIAEFFSPCEWADASQAIIPMGSLHHRGHS